MSLNSSAAKQFVRLAACLGVLTIATTMISASQPARTRRGTGTRRQEQTKNAPFIYGNMTISDYQSLKGTVGVSAEAKGAGTTVEIVDPKVPGAKTRLQAPLLRATWVKGGGELDRLEATGNVHYFSLRPTPEGGTQTLEGIASHATYFKGQAKLVLEGPIEYHGSRKDKGGTVVQSVRGTATSAEYGEEKQIVSLDGNVNATFASPNFKEPTVLTGANSITVDLSKEPVEYDIKGGSIRLVPKEQKKEPSKQPEKKS